MYDKPLKIQWTEINGRAVPLVLPQYWSDEQNDWVVSSEQNRLPVDAQLTGSIVEVVSDDSRYTISPGSNYEIFGGMCLYRKLRGTIRFVQDTPESELEINANLYVNGDFAGRAVVDVQKIASAHYFYEFENYSSELRLRVINNAEAEKTIRNHSLVGVI